MLLRKRMKICGVGFSNLSLLEYGDLLKIQAGKDAGNLFVVTPNVDFIVRAHKDEKFREMIAQADLSLCESAVLLGSCALLGTRFRAKITGHDASDMIFRLARERHEGVFLLGSDASTVKLAAEKLPAAYPGLVISGICDGFFDLSHSAEIVRQINMSGARYLFVGMGSPRQEQWVHEHRSELDVRVIICIGGLFDIFSGKAKRAPRWVQHCGLEWAWRLAHEPKRLWKRYLIDDMLIFWLLPKDFFQGRLYNIKGTFFLLLIALLMISLSSCYYLGALLNLV